MRNFAVVGIVFLLVGFLGCGGGESGTAENSGPETVLGGGTVGAAAVRAQVESRCPTSTDSDFCSRAYRAIARWVAGEITDEEFVNQIVALGGGEEPVTTAKSGEQDEPSYDYDVEEFCTDMGPVMIGWDPVETDYDPAWESLVNIRQRAVYSGQELRSPVICHTPDRHIEYRTETLRIYSYNPDGTSYQNIRKVISKWSCVNSHRNPAPEPTGVCGARRYQVILLFRESLVPSLLERYDGMTRIQIVEDLVLNRLNTWDFVSSTTVNLPGNSESETGFCVDFADGRPCLPGRGSYDWQRIYYTNPQASGVGYTLGGQD